MALGLVDEVEVDNNDIRTIIKEVYGMLIKL